MRKALLVMLFVVLASLPQSASAIEYVVDCGSSGASLRYAVTPDGQNASLVYVSCQLWGEDSNISFQGDKQAIEAYLKSRQQEPTPIERVAVTYQRSDELLASKFYGMDVVGPDNKKIGNVSDVLFNQTGNVRAYVLKIGGFLGIGVKTIAYPPSAFQIVTVNSKESLKILRSYDHLKETTSFEPYIPPGK